MPDYVDWLLHQALNKHRVAIERIFAVENPLL
jgi:hypothetical protein